MSMQPFLTVIPINWGLHDHFTRLSAALS